MEEELHTTKCLEYAAKTGRSFCIVECADARRERINMMSRAADRIDELQKRGSELENDRRMWKSRALACRALVDALVEKSIASMGDFGTGSISAKESATNLAKVAERVWLLEHDAWTQTTQIAKTFVREVKGIMDLHAREPDCDAKILSFAKLVDSTFERFKSIVGDE